MAEDGSRGCSPVGRPGRRPLPSTFHLLSDRNRISIVSVAPPHCYGVPYGIFPRFMADVRHVSFPQTTISWQSLAALTFIPHCCGIRCSDFPPRSCDQGGHLSCLSVGNISKKSVFVNLCLHDPSRDHQLPPPPPPKPPPLKPPPNPELVPPLDGGAYAELIEV